MRPLSGRWTLLDKHAPRFPRVKVLAFDSSNDSINAIVAGTYTQEPVDISKYVTNLEWNPEQCSFIVVDQGNRFHPDTGQYRQYLKPGAVIRVVEGDERVPEEEWVNGFTGLIQTYPSWSWSRRSNANTARVVAVNRGAAQSYNRRKITSKEYSAGTDAGFMLHDMLVGILGFTEPEIRIPEVLGFQLLHTTNQLVQVTPVEAVKAMLELVGGVPFFDGDGRMSYYTKDMNRPPTKQVSRREILDFSLSVVGRADVVNRVVIQFLDATPEPVDGPYQVLGTASVTTGFFRPYERLECYWSQDRRLRAKNTRMKVLQSVNAGLLPVGSESYYQVDDFHGIIEVEIHAWVPILVTFLMANYIAIQLINPDWVWVPPFGGYVPTIPLGRLACAIDLIGILIIMASIGTGHYEVWGIPWEMVYVEKQAIAEECGIEYWERVEKKIENDFFGSMDQAMPVAIMELIWEKATNRKYSFVLTNDPSLELGDILLMPDGHRYQITNWSKSFRPGEHLAMTVEAARVMLGSVGGEISI